MTASISHPGNTVGYRIDVGGRTLAYLPDHEPAVGVDLDHLTSDWISGFALAEGVDVLIHDAQHTSAEYEPKRHWGHCTSDYAVHVAREAGARRLVLFHHDPAHGDDALAVMERDASDFSARIGGAEVTAGYEGLQIELAPALPGSG